MPFRFKPGMIVQHFKRTMLSEQELRESPTMYLYEIIGVATHTETSQSLMIYRSLYGIPAIHARPLEMFMSEVDHAKYPNVTQKYRFQEVSFD